MMFLTSGPLVRTVFPLFICVLTILLVVLVAWGLAFAYQHESIYKCDIFAFFGFIRMGSESKGGRLIKYFGAQIICSLFKFET